jgi:pimeloyl-ACP methyl ester carboxylesterase
MAQRILTLTGWGQPHDALETIAPGATHLDYANFADVEKTMQAIADTGAGYDAAIGWSLGGKLLVQAVGRGIFMPKKLVLIAAPFQFVADTHAPSGMKQEMYRKFTENYERDPVRTLKKGWELITKGDANADTVREYLEAFNPTHVLNRNWLPWMQRLDGFSSINLDFAHFPPTLILHGKNDVVVRHEQSELFASKLPKVKLVTFKNAGHAPHWHDAAKVTQLIAEHLDV